MKCEAIIGSAGIIQSAKEWKAVVGYEGCYEVSSLGRVRSLPRKHPHKTKMVTRGRILRPGLFDGYLRVGLSVDKRLRTFAVHRLVALTFLGERPKGDFQVDHVNMQKTDNRACNLRYVTRQENNARRDRTNMGKRGEHNNASKLREEDVIEIRQLKRAGSTISKLSTQFEVSTITVKRILYGDAWQCVTNGEPVITRRTGRFKQ